MIKKMNDVIVVNCTYHCNAHLDAEDWKLDYSEKGWVAVDDFHIVFNESGKRLGTCAVVDASCLIDDGYMIQVRLSDEDRQQLEHLREIDAKD